jgi:hypothetical protein
MLLGRVWCIFNISGAAFAAIAEAQGISNASLFEDMVAGKFEELERQGSKIEV